MRDPRGRDVINLAVSLLAVAAWFEGRALRLVYAKGGKQWQSSARHVRLRSLVFDRSVTLLNCVDLESGDERQFRLDRVMQASVMD